MNIFKTCLKNYKLGKNQWVFFVTQAKKPGCLGPNRDFMFKFSGSRDGAFVCSHIANMFSQPRLLPNPPVPQFLLL